MTSSRWQAVTKIFEAALELPEQERSSFVQQACAGDTELQSAVSKLLLADREAGSFLEKPVLPNYGNNQAPLPESFLLPAGSMISERFEILRFVGQGGMGQVYEALDHELKAKVALKAIRSEISSVPQMLSRFRREVQLTRLITHPNICRTFDIEHHTSTVNGVSSDITYLTMEFLDGETLATCLRRDGPMSTERALPLVLQMTDALGAAHAAGVIHRDFKPSNVMLVPATHGLRVVVTDFGLARPVVADAAVDPSLTGSQALLGTPIYMAPEQFERGEASIAGDIYSLGLVMFEMVAGQRPFADDTPFAEGIKRFKQPAPSVKALVPNLDAAWDEAISRCLALNPQDRFETVYQVADALAGPTTAAAARPSSISRASSRGRGAIPAAPADTGTTNRTGRRKILAVATIFVLILSLSALAFRHYQRRQASIQFAERDWILVTDFSNQTGERLFDRVVHDLAVQSLSQSSYVNIVPHLSALEAAKRTGLKEVSAIDEKLGREVCLRENYKALLTGSIFKNGSRYTIAMRVEVPGKGTSVSDTETIQSADELFPAVDRLVTRVRRDLGEPLSRIETSSKPLAQVTTSSLEALQRYSSAQDLFGSGELTRSVALANDAIERDPSFAMAHLLLSEAYKRLGEERKSQLHLDLANGYADRVSERERHIIRAISFSDELANDKAADEYQHVLDIFPDDVSALKGFAAEAFWVGRTEQAIAAQQKATALDPYDSDCYHMLMTLLIRSNRFSDALSVYSQAQSRNLAGPDIQFLRALATWGAGDTTGARGILEELGNAGSNWKIFGALFQGKMLAFQGHIDESISAFRAGLEMVQTPDLYYWVPNFQYQIARAEIVKGDMSAAKTECDRFREDAEKTPTPINLQRAGSLSIQVGDLRSARHMAALLEERVRTHPDPFSQMEMHDLLGEVALASRRETEAKQELRSAITFRAWPTPFLSLAEACEAASDWQCAIDAYRRYIDFKGAVLRDDAAEDWTIAHYSLAHAYLKAGNLAAADSEYRQFRALFQSADPGLPILKEAAREFSAPAEAPAR